MIELSLVCRKGGKQVFLCVFLPLLPKSGTHLQRAVETFFFFFFYKPSPQAMNSNISVTFTEAKGEGGKSLIIYDQRLVFSGGDTERLKKFALGVGGGSFSVNRVDV